MAKKRTAVAEANYKKYKNKFTSVLRAAKNKHYKDKFEEIKNDF